MLRVYLSKNQFKSGSIPGAVQNERLLKAKGTRNKGAVLAKKRVGYCQVPLRQGMAGL